MLEVDIVVKNLNNGHCVQTPVLGLVATEYEFLFIEIAEKSDCFLQRRTSNDVFKSGLMQLLNELMVQVEFVDSPVIQSKGQSIFEGLNHSCKTKNLGRSLSQDGAIILKKK